MKKWTSLLLCIALAATLLSACGSRGSSAKRPQLNASLAGATASTFSFSAQPSETLTFSEESKAAVLAAVAEIQPEYPYADLYQLDAVRKRLSFDASVASHEFSALNAAGELDGGHLAALVARNNEAYLASEPFGYEGVEADYIADLCDFIIQVVEAMEETYPDIDWQRVYCNLGHLKILYDVGMLSYARVDQELVLSISKNNTGILLNIKGENAFSQVLTHEIMHIIQIGCVCENIENCVRRAGIAVYWDDFTLNTTDWTWMVEGSAERHMCKLTGGKAISYQYKMDYLCSMTLSVVLREDVAADTMENLCFYSDPKLLFDAFGCETQAQQDELLNMMITLQVLQMQPGPFFEAYKQATGVDPRENEETLNQFCYALKPAICISLAKEFYENLTAFLGQHELTRNDLFFLINLFEGHLNQHLDYTNESKAEINQPFWGSYTALRQALFSALEQDNPGTDFDALYAEYDIDAAGEGLLNAALAMLPGEKLAFLAERAQWQAELLGLGQKVPQ